MNPTAKNVAIFSAIAAVGYGVYSLAELAQIGEEVQYKVVGVAFDVSLKDGFMAFVRNGLTVHLTLAFVNATKSSATISQPVVNLWRAPKGGKADAATTLITQSNVSGDTITIPAQGESRPVKFSFNIGWLAIARSIKPIALWEMRGTLFTKNSGTDATQQASKLTDALNCALYANYSLYAAGVLQKSEKFQIL